jgi:hypothetical protein
MVIPFGASSGVLQSPADPGPLAVGAKEKAQEASPAPSILFKGER